MGGSGLEYEAGSAGEPLTGSDLAAQLAQALSANVQLIDENAALVREREQLRAQLMEVTAANSELNGAKSALEGQIERILTELREVSAERDAHLGHLKHLASLNNSDPRYRSDLKFLLGRLEPMAVEGFSKVRVGRPHDGGYVMLDDFTGVEAAYSFGIHDDVSWDLEIAGRGIDVFQYDHTIGALPENNPRFHWERCGIGASADAALPLTTLLDALVNNGHAQARELILKCDIEDAEWDVFGSTDPECLAQFRQIVVEFHWLQTVVEPSRYHKMLRAVSALTVYHQPIHVHANNYASMAFISGLPVPTVLEVTFVRKDGKAFRRTDETFPTSLDMPNLAGVSDYYLGHFRF